MDAELRTSRLVDHLNDRLSDDERTAVDELLLHDADARAEYEALRQMREPLLAAMPEVAPDHGLERLMASIRTESASPPPAVPARAPLRAWLESAGRWLFRPSLSYAVAASLFAAQFAVLWFVDPRRAGDPDYSELRAPPAADPLAGPFIRVSFNPQAKESDIRFVLISVGASIVGGPTQLGDYYLYVPAARTDAVAQQIRGSPVVERVSVIAKLPPAKD